MKRNLFLFSIFIITLVIFSNITYELENNILNGFNDTTKIEQNQQFCKVSENGIKVDFDTTKSQSNWNLLLKTRAGIIKPNTEYKLSFSYFIQNGSDENSRIQVLLRPISKITPEDDCIRTDVSEQGQWKTANISFTSEKCSDYSMQIFVGEKFKGSIKNFKLSEGTFDKFVSFKTNTKKFVGDLKNIPTGAKEFEVLLPNPKRELVVNAAEFGLSESSKNVRDYLLKAIEYCKKVGASKLVVNKGVYYIDQNDPIKFSGFNDFTFDANGSTFIFYKKRGCHFLVESCTRTKICNFNIDWDWEKDPLASIVEVVNINAKEKYIDIKFRDYKKFPKHDIRLVLMSPYDTARKAVGVECKRDFNFNNNTGQNNPPIKWLAPNLLRVWKIAPEVFSVGEFRRLVHYSYDMGCFHFFDNTHFTLENVNIYSTPGCGVNIGGKHKYWQFKNFNIKLPEGNDPRRCITSTADHSHLINSLGYFKMIGCEFGYGCDDFINMHDCSVFGRKIALRTIKGLRLGFHLGIGDNVEFRNGDYSPANFTAKVVAARYIDKQNLVWEIDFDKDIPKAKIDGFVMFNKKCDTRNIIIRNCDFKCNRARGLLILASDVTVENCKFYHTEQGAIKIETGYTYKLWCEGFGAHNIVIKNNKFEMSNPTGSVNRCLERDIFIGSYQKRDPSDEHTNYPILSDILIENNEFVDTFGLCAYIASAQNVIIRDNKFEAKTLRIKDRLYRGGFYIRNSSDIKILNNTYIESPMFKELGVRYDSTNTNKIIAKGNSIK